MNMIKAALLAGLMVPGHMAQAGYANNFNVYPVAANVFEVVVKSGRAPGDYWCGAGVYVISQLSRSSSDRIFVWRGRGASVGEPGKTSVQFSLTPPQQGAVTSASNTVDLVGNVLSSAQARAYCYDRTIKD
ncbi:hypothetical protein [Falsiruegeria mediterranea]|uniref:Uncharacterized protein n=1 Tax=Falsiruegeria mediterranea M17 TaxID=1200281 RepID=A0A2R8CB60_9RHOB|nr:hypothetical protein [Falsiruegeria mediterranea]SPJ29651.1 hypothetical protein TRM7615_03172 [Falsiruegeria mediterranea M17]